MVKPLFSMEQIWLQYILTSNLQEGYYRLAPALQKIGQGTRWHVFCTGKRGTRSVFVTLPVVWVAFPIWAASGGWVLASGAGSCVLGLGAGRRRLGLPAAGWPSSCCRVWPLHAAGCWAACRLGRFLGVWRLKRGAVVFPCPRALPGAFVACMCFWGVSGLALASLLGPCIAY
jgi:hypothetical protein